MQHSGNIRQSKSFLTFEGKKNRSPRSLENVAPSRFPRGSANPKPRFAFLPRQISSALRPWQVLQRRNVLTRSDAQQSLEEAERESADGASRSERTPSFLLPGSQVNRYWIRRLFLIVKGSMSLFSCYMLQTLSSLVGKVCYLLWYVLVGNIVQRLFCACSV